MKRALLCLPLVVAILLVAPTAHAETWRHADAAGDVLVDPYPGSDPRPAATVPEGDLTRASVRYDEDGLQITSSVRRIGCSSRWEARVVTSRGDVFQLSHGRANSEGCIISYVTTRRNGAAFRCDGVSVSPNGAGYVARVPRTCLGDPYRLRVGILMTSGYGGDETGGTTADDVLRTGRHTQGAPKLGPWVTAG